MRRLYDIRNPIHHFASRRDFLKGSAAFGAAGGLGLFAPRPAAADDDPPDTGRPGQRYVIRGGVGDVDGPESRRFRSGRRAGRRQEDPRRRSELGRGRRGDRCARTHRHARLHRYPPSPVRDGAAKLPRRRGPDQRRIGHAERKPHLLRIHSAQVRAGVPSAGRLHQRAVRRALPARRRRHHGARRLADPPLAAAFRRRHPGAVRYRATRRVRLFRGRRRRLLRPHARICLSAGRHPHQEPVLFVERPARSHDHGRRGLSRSRHLGEVVEDRPAARPADRGAHPVSVRHPADPGPARHELGRLQQRHRDRPRQSVHPHDRNVRSGMAGRQKQGRTGLDRFSDRNEHAPRHAADPQVAKPRHGTLAERRRGGDADGGLLHPDALGDEFAARAS